MDVWTGILMAALFGAIGGLGFVLLQNKGIELPNSFKQVTKTRNITFVDLGFFGQLIIGAIAAIITYTLTRPADITGLIAAALPAGVGGTAILSSYVNGKAASENRQIAERAIQIAETATDNLNSAVQPTPQTGPESFNDAPAPPRVPLTPESVQTLQAQLETLKQELGLQQTP